MAKDRGEARKPSNQEIIRMAREARTVFDKTANLVKAQAKFAVKWTDPQKPIRGRGDPGIPPTDGMPVGLVLRGAGLVLDRFGLSVKREGRLGRRLRNAAVQGQLAKAVEGNIKKLWASINSQPDSAKKAANLAYLKEIEHATVLAAYTCQQLLQGKAPSNVLRRGAPSKTEVRLAAAWVVTLACNNPGLIHQNVKKAAVQAYPLLSAGVALNEILEPVQAINVAFRALGAV